MSDLRAVRPLTRRFAVSLRLLLAPCIATSSPTIQIRISALARSGAGVYCACGTRDNVHYSARKSLMAHLDDDGRENALRGSAENLYARFHAPLISYFRKRIGDRAEAEDLTQEVFVRLVKAEGAFSLVSAHAYVFTIAANLLRDRQRRAASHQLQAHYSLDQAVDGKYADLVEAIEPERVLRGREDLKLVLEALAELDERTRNIFLLFRLERLRQREIAAIYGISEGAVEKRILKASIHIAARLKERK